MATHVAPLVPTVFVTDVWTEEHPDDRWHGYVQIDGHTVFEHHGGWHHDAPADFADDVRENFADALRDALKKE